MPTSNDNLHRRLDQTDAIREALLNPQADDALGQRAADYLRKCDAELSRNQERLHLALDGGEVGLWDLNLQTDEIYWSRTLYHLLGREPSVPITKETFFEYIHEDDRPRVRKHAQEWFAGGGDFEDEFRIVREDDRVRWLVSRGRIYLDDQDRPLRAVGVNYDITDRKIVADALTREREMLRSIVDRIPVLLVMWNPHLQRFTLNRYAEQVLGWTTADANRGDFMTKAYPDETYRDRVKAYMQSLEPGWQEWQVTARDGRIVPIDWANVRLTDDTMIGIGVDLRERKRAEQALRESEERLRLAAQAAKFGTYDADLVAGTLYWSPEMRAIMGVGESKPLPLPGTVPDFIHPDDVEQVRRMFRHAFDPNKDGTIFDEHRIVWPDGSVRWVQVRGQVEFEGEGEHRRPVRSRGMILDVTRRKQAEQQLKELNETLEQRVAKRTAQVRDQARQLRALAAQLSQTEQRERKRLARILHDHVQQLIVAARMQLYAVGSCNDLDKIRVMTGKVSDILSETLEASRSLTVDLSPPVLDEAGLIGGLNWLSARMRETHQFTVNLRADNRAEPATEDVRFLLFECVRELLFNAVKHADVSDAEVVLMCSDDAHISVIVSDQGKGFDPDVLNKRGADEATFGLFSIQQRLAHIGGRMHIASAPGKGTEVTLTVPGSGPKASNDDADKPVGPEAGTKSVTAHDKDELIRILIVDDHKIMREGLASLLRFQPDMEVVGEAADGPQAIAMADDLHPDIVIMDVNLGKMGGVEATRQILARHPDIRVIGLSMHIDEEVADAMRRAGATAYLTKSGRSDDLINTIRSCWQET